MTNRKNDLPERLASCFRSGRGDPPAGLTDSNSASYEAFRLGRDSWLTCQNSVCQDFLFLNEGFLLLFLKGKSWVQRFLIAGSKMRLQTAICIEITSMWPIPTIGTSCA